MIRRGTDCASDKLAEVMIIVVGFGIQKFLMRPDYPTHHLRTRRTNDSDNDISKGFKM